MISSLKHNQLFGQGFEPSFIAKSSDLSWLGKPIQEVTPSIGMGGLSNHFLETTSNLSPMLHKAGSAAKSFLSNAASVVAYESAYELLKVYQGHKQIKEMDELHTLEAQKSAYMENYNAPWLGKSEISSTLASTTLTNVLMSTGLVAATLPTTATGVCSTIGITLAVRALKKAAYAYKIKSINAQLAKIYAAKKATSKPCLRKNKKEGISYLQHLSSKKKLTRRPLKRLQ